MPDVKIKGYSGNELHYADVPKVWLAAEESTEDNPVLVPFTYGEAIEEVPVELDFSNGENQVIDAPEGYMVKSAIIQRPANLIPGNIAEGVDIAGIIGTLAAGGSGAKIEIVHIDYTNVVKGENTFLHNLGAIPDIIFFSAGNMNPSAAEVNTAMGFSSAFVEKYPKFSSKGFARYRLSSSSTPSYKWDFGQMDTLTSGISFHNVTDKTFSIGHQNAGLSTSWSYDFLLIGGLT